MEDLLWVEKYRPHTIADTILPADLKTTFAQFVEQGFVPNLMLAGPPGIGKTTIARAVLDELGCEYVIINGSLEGNIDKLRTDIQSFASSVALTGGRKYVILDEADYLTQFTQPALRNFMEEYSKNCGFIFTCNYKNKIIDALHSRCAVIDFKFAKAEKPHLAGQFFKRACSILEAEGVVYDKKAVAGLVEKHFPNWRRALNEMQRYAATGKIDVGVLVDHQKENVKTLVDFMKEKNYTSIRKWVSAHSELDAQTMFRDFYDQASTYFTPQSVPALVLLLGKYQYQASFAADPEINLMAFLTEVMIDCELA